MALFNPNTPPAQPYPKIGNRMISFLKLNKLKISASIVGVEMPVLFTKIIPPIFSGVVFVFSIVSSIDFLKEKEQFF